MKASYVPGSFHKKFYGSYASQMNRRAVSSASSAINSYGTSIFSTNQSQVEGLNEIIVKQVAAKLQAEAQAKLQNAAGLKSIAGLGAFTDSSA